ncbi:MAG: thiamine phosphate synthase [Erythrobacter sp.]
MTRSQTIADDLPNLWLLSDERNDGALEQAIARLPRGSGFVFRHYHLTLTDRRTRFASLLPLLRAGSHWAIASTTPEIALGWGADGVYGAAAEQPRAEAKWIATAHDAEEISAANHVAVDAVMLSPVFPTRSHPDAKVLGTDGFHRLARASACPVIALGGMNAERAKQLNWPRWAAIDGLS